MTLRLRQGIALRVALLSAPFAWGLNGQAAEGDWLRCRQIAADSERLRCYDAAATEAPATTPSAAVTAESLFGKPSDETRAAAARELGLADTGTLEARVAAFRHTSAGKLVITLENGQIWTQLDADALRMRAGESVRIRKAAFGSYLLQKQSGGLSIRVRRTD